ncbi:flavin reductase family protein [Nocardioides alcanivorans]|uniref:flavin reductase family protein n=1 Tax=Nocardioides alcanivorans TaxID=2897352 RepID=UPI001F271641|nr:flavin reductase [Nocardioides alcanivorans]
MTIHSGHPFAQPPEDRDQARRFRGRLGGAVSLWTTGAGRDRAGLTVSSLMVAGGEPARILGLLDPDSDLADALAADARFVVQLLEWPHRDLAEMFAGTAPAPGGLFAQAEFVDTAWGPRLVSASTWVGLRVESLREVGWSTEVCGLVEEIVLGEENRPLEHRRGRWKG